MRMLFELDQKDYSPNSPVRVRPSARAIIIKDGKVDMVHSKKYNYYKFPGGGIEADEREVDALAREVQEEAGLSILADSVREYGQARRIQKDDNDNIFIQDNYYFFCDVDEHVGQQNLDDYEADEGFTFQYIDPQTAIDANRNSALTIDDFRKPMLERESRVLELLLSEGYFNS